MTQSNKPMSTNHRRSQHHDWAKGFQNKRTGAKEYHPYTRKDFQFNTNK